MLIFPHQQAEKSLQNQHVLSILQVGSHQLQYRFFRTNKPKSRYKTNTFCPITRNPRHASLNARKTSHSLDFNFDVQETGGSSEAGGGFCCTHPVPECMRKRRNYSERWELVEMGGIEPPSDGRPRGLLRAHPAIDFLACDVMQACCQRSSVDEMSERTHRHGPHPVAP